MWGEGVIPRAGHSSDGRQVLGLQLLGGGVREQGGALHPERGAEARDEHPEHRAPLGDLEMMRDDEDFRGFSSAPFSFGLPTISAVASAWT